MKNIAIDFDEQPESLIERCSNPKLLKQLKEIEELIEKCKEIDEIKQQIDKIKELMPNQN